MRIRNFSFCDLPHMHSSQATHLPYFYLQPEMCVIESACPLLPLLQLLRCVMRPSCCSSPAERLKDSPPEVSLTSRYQPHVRARASRRSQHHAVRKSTCTRERDTLASSPPGSSYGWQSSAETAAFQSDRISLGVEPVSLSSRNPYDDGALQSPTGACLGPTRHHYPHG